MIPERPQKIAILGGGVGAMSAAWAITQTPDWEKKYEITIYQLGWRLGLEDFCADGNLP